MQTGPCPHRRQPPWYRMQRDCFGRQVPRLWQRGSRHIQDLLCVV